MNPWLARLRHDLLKPALWCLRDLRDSGRLDGEAGSGALTPADLRVLRRSLLELYNSEGRRVTALVLWRELRADSDAPAAAAALDAFAESVAAADAAAQATDGSGGPSRGADLLAAVRRLESAFLLLGQALEPEPGR